MPAASGVSGSIVGVSSCQLSSVSTHLADALLAWSAACKTCRRQAPSPNLSSQKTVASIRTQLLIV